jgi:hypothetical protein
VAAAPEVVRIDGAPCQPTPRNVLFPTQRLLLGPNGTTPIQVPADALAYVVRLYGKGFAKPPRKLTAHGGRWVCDRQWREIAAEMRRKMDNVSTLKID